MGENHRFHIGEEKIIEKLKNSKVSNKKISKVRYIVEQYFGLTHLHDNAYRARFTDILKNIWDSMCRMMAFNIMRGVKLLEV